MFSSIARFFRSFLLFVLLLTSGASVILGGLYINSRNENLSLESKINDLSRVTNKEEPVQLPVDLEFSDIGEHILIKYNSEWTLYVDSNISSDFSYEPYGKILEKYDIYLEKNSSVLKFSGILKAIDGTAFGLTEEEYDYKLISDQFIRFKLKEETTWRYGSIENCEEISGELLGDLTGSDYCAGGIIPSLGVHLPAFVTLKSTNEAEILEADQIFLSGTTI